MELSGLCFCVCVVVSIASCVGVCVFGFAFAHVSCFSVRIFLRSVNFIACQFACCCFVVGDDDGVVCVAVAGGCVVAVDGNLDDCVVDLTGVVVGAWC